MEHATHRLSTPEGPALFTRVWAPAEPPHAVVVLVHGVHEHSGRYGYVAAQLNLNGIAVVAYDLRAHGQTGGPLMGYVERFDDHLGDLARVLDFAAETFPGVPRFLLGHSMGGAIAASYVAQRGPDELAGLVLSSAALRVPPDYSPVLQRLADLIHRVAPRLRAAPIDTAALTRDPAVHARDADDPHYQVGAVRVRTAVGLRDAMPRIFEGARRFTLPVLLFHGTADRITDPGGSQALHDAIPSADKTLTFYDGFFHETMNEPERDRVIGDVAAWVLSRAA